MDKTACSQTYKEIDQSIVKIEMESEQNFKPENLNINFVEVPSIKEHADITILPTKIRGRGRGRGRGRSRGRGRGRGKYSNNSQISALSKQSHSTDVKVDLKTLKKNRFRPIRPKPLQPSTSTILRHKFGLPIMNMATLPSNRVILPSTMKEKGYIAHVRHITLSDESDKIKDIKPISNDNSDVFSSDTDNKTINTTVVNSKTINTTMVNSKTINPTVANSKTINDSNKSKTINIIPITDEN
ncbi:uncharacterized protein, partial [Mycetomoellerius zeteki]|uniref:uncharacterized protein n=1 Tax=Mycetomoellerius zeteki TaxID=64791 RepID=UPI00084E3B86